MKKTNNLSTGTLGEKYTSNYLKSKGLKILEQNFRSKFGEIDIVAMEKNTLVFVEVKTRRSNIFGIPEEAIRPWKLQRLIKSAQYYKLIHPELPNQMRIDAVSVYLSANNRLEKISLYKNITL